MRHGSVSFFWIRKVFQKTRWCQPPCTSSVVLYLGSSEGFDFQMNGSERKTSLFFFSGHVFDVCFVNFLRNRIGLYIIDIFQWCFSSAYFWKKVGYNLHRMNMSNPGGIDLTNLSNFFQKRLWEIPSIYIWWHSKKWPLRHSDEFLQYESCSRNPYVCLFFRPSLQSIAVSVFVHCDEWTIHSRNSRKARVKIISKFWQT